MTRKPLQAPLRSLHPFVLNLLALTAWWSIASTLVPVARRASSEWPSIPVSLLLACTIGIPIALWLSARVTAYFLAGQVAFFAVELAMHSYFGIASVQGGPTHFAVMGAGTLGVILGTLIQSGAPVIDGQALWSAHDVFGSALRAGIVLRQRAGFTAHVAAAIVAFCGSELAIHTIFGLHPFREGLTHFAIVVAALLGVVFGTLIVITGDPFSLRRRLSARGKERSGGVPGALEMVWAARGLQ